MGFLARLYADGRGSAKAQAPALRVAEEAVGAEAPEAQARPAWELTGKPSEAGPEFRVGDDPFAAGKDRAPAAAEPAVPEERTRTAARPAAGVSIGDGGGETGQARYSHTLSETGPEGKSGMRSRPATRSAAPGANPASGGPVQDPRAVAPLAEPASPGPVAETLRGRAAAGNGGAMGGENGGVSIGGRSGVKIGGKGAGESRPSDPIRPEAPDAMHPGAAPASRPGAGAFSGSPDRQAEAVSAGRAVSAAQKRLPGDSGPGPVSGGDPLDAALGAMAGMRKDRTRLSGAFDAQGNLEGTRNPERTARPEPAPGPRVVIGSLEIRVEAPPYVPAAPQESAAAARSRSYRVEW